jgi:ribonuclease P protein subunit POP4
MLMQAQNLLKGELIGLRVRITGSKNKNLIGLEGTIVDETKNMFMIQKNMEEKKIAKDQCVFEFTLENGEKISVEGKLLVARPEMRLKKTNVKKRV